MSRSSVILKKWRGSPVLVYVLLTAIVIVFSLPVLWMLASSLKPDDQLLVDSNRLLPRVTEDDPAEGRTSREVSIFRPAYWRAIGTYAKDNYARAWNSPVADFPLYLKNTLIISGLSVLGMVISSSIVAYGFARIRWRGRNALFVVVLATMMIPFPVLMAPLYIVFRHLGWIGTFKPLWVPAWFGGAFSIFLLRQFFLTIPRQLDEAAMLDGCSHFGIFRRIILPLSKPALAVVVLFHFVATWNDFGWPADLSESSGAVHACSGAIYVSITARRDTLESPHGRELSGGSARAGCLPPDAANLRAGNHNEGYQAMSLKNVYTGPCRIRPVALDPKEHPCDTL